MKFTKKYLLIFLFNKNKYLFCAIISIVKIKRLTILKANQKGMAIMEFKQLVHQLISISVIHRFIITKSALSAGLYYGQPNMLQYIKSNEECTQKEIADALYISPPSVATSLKRMEKAALITRTADVTDPRKKRISITQKGKSALSEFEAICKTTDEKMFKGFSKDDLAQLHLLLTRLHNNLDSESLSKKELHDLLCSEKGENENA